MDQARINKDLFDRISKVEKILSENAKSISKLDEKLTAFGNNYKISRGKRNSFLFLVLKSIDYNKGERRSMITTVSLRIAILASIC